MRILKRTVIAVVIMALLGGVGSRNASGDAGAIASGAVALAVGAGATYGGCVAVRTAMKPDTPPIAPQPAVPPSGAQQQQ